MKHLPGADVGNVPVSNNRDTKVGKNHLVWLTEQFMEFVSNYKATIKTN